MQSYTNPLVRALPPKRVSHMAQCVSATQSESERETRTHNYMHVIIISWRACDCYDSVRWGFLGTGGPAHNVG